jgi:endonuclease YncB( thermonuclease family)
MGIVASPIEQLHLARRFNGGDFMTVDFQRASRFVVALAMVAILGTPLASSTNTILGTADVTDGDSLKVAGCPIRLHGIDAPEKDQWCLDGNGRQVECGGNATQRLRAFVGSRQVSCEKKGVDLKYCRTLAACSVDGEDIQAWMVREGLALAYKDYSNDYVPQQDQAQAAQRGLWGGSFIAPWDFRHYNRAAAVLGNQPSAADQKRLLAPISSEGAPSLDCIIKGNVSANGKIYHMPGTNIYSRVRMNKPNVRWFCSEQDAVAAGWRAAKQPKLNCEKRLPPHCR